MNFLVGIIAAVLAGVIIELINWTVPSSQVLSTFSRRVLPGFESGQQAQTSHGESHACREYQSTTLSTTLSGSHLSRLQRDTAAKRPARSQRRCLDQTARSRRTLAVQRYRRCAVDGGSRRAPTPPGDGHDDANGSDDPPSHLGERACLSGRKAPCFLVSAGE